MKVILLQDIQNLGKKYDVKEVKDGHARNLLLPKGLVKIADDTAMLWLKDQKVKEEERAEEVLKKFQALASKIDGQEVVVEVKVGDEGQMFESVNAQKIMEGMKNMGIEVSKSQIELKEPIKEMGEYPIKIKLEHNLEAEITVVVTEAK
jgi:large subunit ribosomal protein L9